SSRTSLPSRTRAFSVNVILTSVARRPRTVRAGALSGVLTRSWGPLGGVPPTTMCIRAVREWSACPGGPDRGGSPQLLVSTLSVLSQALVRPGRVSDGEGGGLVVAAAVTRSAGTRSEGSRPAPPRSRPERHGATSAGHGDKG